MTGSAPVARRFGQPADFGKAGDGVVVFLRIVVSADPPGFVVSGHRELRKFFFYIEISEFILQWELVPQAQAVVVEAEAEIHLRTVLPAETDQHFIVVVAYMRLLAPHRIPDLVFAVESRADDLESLFQVASVSQFETEPGGFDHGLAVIFKRVGGGAVTDEAEAHPELAVRALQHVFRYDD